MANKIQIKWPKGGKEEVDFRLLVASGRADVTILGVSGVCRPTSGGDPTPGKQVVYYLDGKGKQPFYRWMILFKFPQPGEHELTVTGQTVGGEPEEERRRFTARASSGDDVDSHANVASITAGITIDSHANGANITAEKDDFVPYGSLNAPLGEVKTTKSLGEIVLPDSKFSDPVIDQFWSAQFPSLPSETYDLHVEDNSAAAQADVSGLTVD